jgi:hypothetical protein
MPDLNSQRSGENPEQNFYALGNKNHNVYYHYTALRVISKDTEDLFGVALTFTQSLHRHVTWNPRQAPYRKHSPAPQVLRSNSLGTLCKKVRNDRLLPVGRRTLTQLVTQLREFISLRRFGPAPKGFENIGFASNCL